MITFREFTPLRKKLKNYSPPEEHKDDWMWWDEETQGWIVRHREFKKVYGTYITTKWEGSPTYEWVSKCVERIA